MRPLEKQFEANYDKTGVQQFIQVKRTHDVVMYKRLRSDGSLFGFEVFKVKIRNKGQALPGGNVEKEDRECYPGANAFGKSAWSMREPELAEIYFNNLVRYGKVKSGKKVKTAAPTQQFLNSKSVQVKKSRGRQKKYTAVINPPDGTFTLDDLVDIYNEPKATLYLKLKSLIQTNKVKEVSSVKTSKKGRAKKIYQKM